jgi:hypothetical protein
LREVVEAVHEEKAASDDPPDEKRNVVDARHKPLLTFHHMRKSTAVSFVA